MADTSLLWTGVVVASVGLLTGVVALKAQREHRLWCAGKARAQGVVSRIAGRRSQGLSEDASGMPTGAHGIAVAVVRFKAANGGDYEIDAPEVRLEEGIAVEVAYDLALPSGGRAVERSPKVLIPIVLIVLGAALAAYAATRPA